MVWHLTHFHRADVTEEGLRLEVVLDDGATMLVNVTSSDMTVWHSEVFKGLDGRLNAAAQRYHTRGTATYTRGTATCIIEPPPSAWRREACGR